MTKTTYKAQCYFFIEAKDKDEAELLLKQEEDFVEAHVLITEASSDDLEDIERGFEEIYTPLDNN